MKGQQIQVCPWVSIASVAPGHGVQAREFTGKLQLLEVLHALVSVAAGDLLLKVCSQVVNVTDTRIFFSWL